MITATREAKISLDVSKRNFQNMPLIEIVLKSQVSITGYSSRPEI